MHTRRAWLAAVISTAVLALGFAAIATPAGATTTNPSTTTNASCLRAHDDEWPDWVNGQPAGFDAGDNGGVYLWHDGDGWHLRVTHKTDDRLYVTGTLHTSGVFVDVSGVALERNDHFTIGPDGHTITFRFDNYGHIDGLDFRTHCAPALEMGFQADDHRLPANRIVIGHNDQHPDNNPFRIVRTR